MAWRGVPRRGDANRMTGDCLVLTVLCSMILLMIGGTEQHTGRVVEVENTVQILGTGCCRILPSQTRNFAYILQYFARNQRP